MQAGTLFAMNKAALVRHVFLHLSLALALATLVAGCALAGPGESSNSLQMIVAEVRVTAPDPQPYTFFGHAVAIDGDRAVVGAWGFSANAGAAYVFQEVEGVWQLEAALRAPDGSPRDRFGHAVAIDEHTIVVGAVHDVTAGFRAGAAHVFELEDDGWAHAQTLTSPEGISYQQFGSAVAVHGDTLAVGASGFSKRAAYLYQRNPSGWELDEVLTPLAEDEDARFASTLALRGETLVVGAWRDEPYDDEEFLRGGAAYVFERDEAGWRRSGVLQGPFGAAEFGHAVATDGVTIVVSTPSQGARVYAREGGVWRQEATLSAMARRHYGTSVAVDGDKIFIGASGQQGAAYEYSRLEGAWTLTRKITAADASDSLHFGLAAAVSGQRFIAGATGADDGGVASGAAYLIP